MASSMAARLEPVWSSSPRGGGEQVLWPMAKLLYRGPGSWVWPMVLRAVFAARALPPRGDLDRSGRAPRARAEPRPIPLWRLPSSLARTRSSPPGRACSGARRPSRTRRVGVEGPGGRARSARRGARSGTCQRAGSIAANAYAPPPDIASCRRGGPNSPWRADAGAGDFGYLARGVGIPFHPPRAAVEGVDVDAVVMGPARGRVGACPGSTRTPRGGGAPRARGR